MPAAGTVSAAQPPRPPLARSHSRLAGAASSDHHKGSIIARVSSDAPCLSMFSPFASSSAQSRQDSHSPAFDPPLCLPLVGSAAFTAAGLLAAAARQAGTARPPTGSPASTSTSLSSSGSSGAAWQPTNAAELPAYSPCVRASRDGRFTPVPPPSTPSQDSSKELSSTGTDAAVPLASRSLTRPSAVPSGCLTEAAAAWAEPLAAIPGAALPVLLPQLLGPGALPDALKGCLVHPAEISFLQWPDEPLQQLGEGASATVFRAHFHGEAVAVKVMHVGHGAEAQQAFMSEAARMQQLRHDHIVSFRGISLDGPNAMLIMEYCPGRDLMGLLQAHTSDGSGRRLFGWWRRGRHVALHLARALAHLHSLGIVHMDVKSSNVLLTAQGSAKLCDVGLSHLLESMRLPAVTCTGTFAWSAPEVLLGDHDCGLPADIYSFGVVHWELLTGERPARGHLRLPKVPAECPQEVLDLMLRCLSTDPGARPTADQLVAQLEALVRLQPSVAAAANAHAT